MASITLAVFARPDVGLIQKARKTRLIVRLLTDVLVCPLATVWLVVAHRLAAAVPTRWVRTQKVAGGRRAFGMTIDSIRALLRAATPCVAAPQD
jgi:hypothetical protein